MKLDEPNEFMKKYHDNYQGEVLVDLPANTEIDCQQYHKWPQGRSLVRLFPRREKQLKCTFAWMMLGLEVSSHQSAGWTVAAADAAVVLLGCAAQFVITADNLQSHTCTSQKPDPTPLLQLWHESRGNISKVFDYNCFLRTTYQHLIFFFFALFQSVRKTQTTSFTRPRLKVHR